MSSFLRQSTASQSRAIGPFLDTNDADTAMTGLTIANTDIQLIVNGGASATKNSGGATHRSNGTYGITFDATDTATVGELEVSVKVAGALPVFKTFWVLEAAVYDAFFAASAPGYVANAPVNVAQFGGTNGAFSSGRPEVNTTHAAGTAWGSGAITNAAFANDAITAAKVAADVSAEIADQVWDEAIAGHAGAGSTGEALSDASGGGGLDAAGVRAALGMSSANLDTQLGAIDTVVDTIDGRLTGARAQPGAGSIAPNGSVLSKVDDLHKFMRNKITDGGGFVTVFADNGTDPDHKATVSDDGTAFTRGEFTAP